MLYILHLYQITSFNANWKNVIEKAFFEAASAVTNAIAAQSTSSMSTGTSNGPTASIDQPSTSSEIRLCRTLDVFLKPVHVILLSAIIYVCCKANKNI